MSLRRLLEALSIPILQAPMVGASGVALCAAVGEAGGLGALAAGAMAPEDIGPAVAAVRAASAAPFFVNLLMAPAAAPQPGEVAAALARLTPFYARLGMTTPEAPNRFAPDFEAQLDAVIAARPAGASFTFGVLARERIAELHAAGILVIGTATTVAEALAWAEVGADGLCAQGFEAGGHRGHFLAEAEASLVGTMALVATIRAAVDLPLIAAGGIMEGRSVAAALALGADAVQMGTAFLLADEAVTAAPWRRAVETAGPDTTRLTRAYTGRQARGMETEFMRRLRPEEDEVPAYPVQNRLTQPMRAAASAAGDSDLMSLWAGQGVSLAASGRAGDLMRRWWQEAADASDALARRVRGRNTA
ncbi:MAG: NAD(P)H-dependent flavin oxidoreductase [Phenylobacterium sp.]